MSYEPRYPDGSERRQPGRVARWMLRYTWLGVAVLIMAAIATPAIR